MNLCVNARDAMPGGGKLTIILENTVLDDIYLSVHPEATTGYYVKITVIDTGTGIPREILDKIFEPFFTTKEVGKGTGLGLSTSLNIVKSHGGFIDVSSVVNKGTQFKIFLPANNQAELAQRTSPPRSASTFRGKGEMILVVDDEENFRTVSKATMERFGYQVVVAAHGAEAVAIYALQRHNIALVLTDMDMPIMDGVATIHALKAINPEVKIVCSSGMESKAGSARAAEAGVAQFISKPYNSETLLKTVARTLQPAGQP
jgi:CheY-like chemotaxis protein